MRSTLSRVLKALCSGTGGEVDEAEDDEEGKDVAGALPALILAPAAGSTDRARIVRRASMTTRWSGDIEVGVSRSTHGVVDAASSSSPHARRDAA